MINFMKKVDGADSDDETTPVQKYYGLSDRPLRNTSNLHPRPKTRTDTDRPMVKAKVEVPMSPRNLVELDKESHNNLLPINTGKSGELSD